LEQILNCKPDYQLKILSAHLPKTTHMKKYFLTLLSFSVISMLFAQNDNSGSVSGDPALINSPYHTSVVKDGLAIAGAVGVTALG
jgi:hypothetical protein